MNGLIALLIVSAMGLERDLFGVRGIFSGDAAWWAWLCLISNGFNIVAIWLIISRSLARDVRTPDAASKKP